MSSQNTNSMSDSNNTNNVESTMCSKHSQKSDRIVIGKRIVKSIKKLRDVCKIEIIRNERVCESKNCISYFNNSNEINVKLYSPCNVKDIKIDDHIESFMNNIKTDEITVELIEQDKRGNNVLSVQFNDTVMKVHIYVVYEHKEDVSVPLLLAGGTIIGALAIAMMYFTGTDTSTASTASTASVASVPEMSVKTVGKVCDYCLKVHK